MTAMMGGPGQQHPQNTPPFGVHMCPPPLATNGHFMGPPQGQMMPMLPPHPFAQMPPHMLPPHPPVFDPQIMRDSSTPFVFKKKNSNQDHESQQQKVQEPEDKPKQLNNLTMH